jgi:hypothetical protein
MRQAEKQPVFGPPESMREHVVAASRAMKTGDWSASVNFLINEKMNGKVSEENIDPYIPKYRFQQSKTSFIIRILYNMSIPYLGMEFNATSHRSTKTAY